MNGLVAIFWITLFNAAFNTISAKIMVSMKFIKSNLNFVRLKSFQGPFYCVQEGFFPRTFENEYVFYETIVKGSKTDYEDRKVYGNFTFKKPLANIGVSISSVIFL